MKLLLFALMWFFCGLLEGSSQKDDYHSLNFGELSIQLEKGKNQLRLVDNQTGREASLIEIPAAPHFVGLANDKVHALWDSSGSAVVIALPVSGSTLIIAFTKDGTDKWHATDISKVENGNLGKLGKRRETLSNIYSKPIKWMPRQDGLFQVLIETQALDKIRGQTMSAKEALLIGKTGIPFWR